MTTATDLAKGLDPAKFAASLGFVPEDWQASLMRSTRRRILVTCSRQVGKSASFAIKALHVAIYQPGSVCLIFSPSQRQSDELLNTVRTYYRMVGLGRPAKDNGSELSLDNGSRIVSLPGSESSTRGFSAVRLLILDEAAYASDDLLPAVSPMVAADGQLVVMSTPNGRRGFFFEIHQANSSLWERHGITVHESAQWSPQRIEEERSTMTAAKFAREYECSFDDASSQLFKTNLVRAMFIPGMRTMEIT